MIVAPPLFSRDVFSYAAQGEMTAHHISPYLFGPFYARLGPLRLSRSTRSGATRPRPYGPFFLFLDGSIDRIARHNQLATVVGLRLLETLAVAMIGYGVVLLARGLQPRPGRGLRAERDEPAGAADPDRRGPQRRDHGRLSRGRRSRSRSSADRSGRCSSVACATAIKAPAAIGLAFVAWTWLGPRASVRERVKPIAHRQPGRRR